MEQLELDKQALELDTKRRQAGTDVALMPNTVRCLEGRCIVGALDTCPKLIQSYIAIGALMNCAMTTVAIELLTSPARPAVRSGKTRALLSSSLWGIGALVEASNPLSLKKRNSGPKTLALCCYIPECHALTVNPPFTAWCSYGAVGAGQASRGAGAGAGHEATTSWYGCCTDAEYCALLRGEMYPGGRPTPVQSYIAICALMKCGTMTVGHRIADHSCTA